MQNIKGRSRKIYVKFSGVLVFDLEISKGCNIHILTKFQGCSFLKFLFGVLFYLKFPGVQRKTKTIPGVFSKKYVINPPSLFGSFF